MPSGGKTLLPHRQTEITRVCVNSRSFFTICDSCVTNHRIVNERKRDRSLSPGSLRARGRSRPRTAPPRNPTPQGSVDCTSSTELIENLGPLACPRNDFDQGPERAVHGFCGREHPGNIWIQSDDYSLRIDSRGETIAPRRAIIEIVFGP
jgi:hypothetical protein